MILAPSFISDRPIANAASVRDRRSSSVNRMRPDTFSLRMRFSKRRYSFCSISSRLSRWANVAITGKSTQSGLRSTPFSILDAAERRGMHKGREYHGRYRWSILKAR